MNLRDFDKGNPKLPRHFKPSQIEDEYETPKELFISLIQKYQIFPKLDVASTKENRKCLKYFSIEDNALEQEWLEDSWCNHPHTLHAEFVEKNYQQWKKHNKNRMMIIPANCGRTSYWHEFIEPYAKYNFIEGSIRFLQNGKPSKDTSRNAYVCVRWYKV
jgi:phage N-6-adenine-methyltransferase